MQNRDSLPVQGIYVRALLERRGGGIWGCDGGCCAAGAYGCRADMLMGTITKKSQREELKQLWGRIIDTNNVTDMGLGTFHALVVTHCSDYQTVVSDDSENSSEAQSQLSREIML